MFVASFVEVVGMIWESLSLRLFQESVGGSAGGLVGGSVRGFIGVYWGYFRSLLEAECGECIKNH